MRIMVDYRCPCCNRIVSGTHEVMHVTNTPQKATTCKHCNTPIALQVEDEGLGMEAYYAPAVA